MAGTVEKWLDESTEKARDEFYNSSWNDLYGYHHGLGTKIRNHFRLWDYEWRPVMVDGVDHSINHPDDLSMQVIRQVWLRRQACQMK